MHVCMFMGHDFGMLKSTAVRPNREAAPIILGEKGEDEALLIVLSCLVERRKQRDYNDDDEQLCCLNCCCRFNSNAGC